MMLRYGEWIAAAAGAATAFAFAPHGFYILAVLGPPSCSCSGSSLRRGRARAGFFFGAALFGTAPGGSHRDTRLRPGAGLARADPDGRPARDQGRVLRALVLLVARIAPDPSAPRSLLLIPAAWTLLEWLRGCVSPASLLELGYATAIRRSPPDDDRGFISSRSRMSQRGGPSSSCSGTRAGRDSRRSRSRSFSGLAAI